MRKRPEAKFLTSAAFPKDFPPPDGPEFAILGRSNVGKSSFINHVLERQGLARTSRKPGKTSLANFFRIDSTMIWVDLPGYGYAKTSGSERERWSQLIRIYGEKRECLTGILWLVDVRHPGVKLDLEARAWLDRIGVPVFPILTKGDKLTRQQAMVHSGKASKILRFTTEPVIYSTLQHASRERFWDRFTVWRQSLEAGDV
ncbi:MAG: YihA family ribosome biogenesis GTP-binding protein [Chitinispirillaceae bacterium]|nr:YihA family ribosome biogenesis GTP-binding protein [Chitinispirillaceae bacterium]